MNADLYGIEAALIFAICETESHFNTQAESPKGALGIMQIMPKTGEWIASQIGITEYKNSDLFDAELNIRFGSWYLSYLMSRFDESWLIVAAYNAGEGTVKGWIDSGIDAIDDIPISETVFYVRRVQRALSRYRRKKYAAFD